MSAPAAPPKAAYPKASDVLERLKAMGLDVDLLLQELESTGDFKVLRRFKPLTEFNPDDGGEKRRLMALDTETTGLEVEKDRVIELGYLIVEYNPNTGKLYRVIDTYSGLQDPGFPIPEESQKIHGIKDEDVAGKTFDIEKINRDVESCDLIIAHNAGGVDRKFLEAGLPVFATKPWACGMNDAPWEELGITTRKQEFIAYKLGSVFYDAHRALTDAEVLVGNLTLPAHDGKPLFHHILERARKPSYRIWADGSPFESKDELRRRGYRWSPQDAEPGMRPKCWYLPSTEDIEGELQWLSDNIYRRERAVTVDLITAMERYSQRTAKRDSITTPAPNAPKQAGLRAM